ncbi:hypothetical protein PM082_013521 [Marasmius tenuissimus]|nr:hypothetical protein PM082_013521 [Marasmius tenuissimus]
MTSLLSVFLPVALATLSRAQNFDDDRDDHNRTRNIITGVIITMVILMLFTSCWMYNVRRQRMQQMMMARHTAFHNQNLQNSYNQSPYDVNRAHSFNQGQSQGWMGPPPAGPPPPGYSPSPHPGHQGPYQPPPGAPPKYGGDGGKGGEDYGYQYPPVRSRFSLILSWYGKRSAEPSRHLSHQDLLPRAVSSINLLSELPLLLMYILNPPHATVTPAKPLPVVSVSFGPDLKN